MCTVWRMLPQATFSTQCTHCPILINRESSRQFFEKYSNTTIHENPSSGSRVVPCGQTNRRTDMTQLIDAFRNFANAPKKEIRYIILVF